MTALPYCLNDKRWQICYTKLELTLHKTTLRTKGAMCVHCPNCGAEYDDLEARCPFCKTFNYQGAENQYFEKLEELRDDMEELDRVPTAVYRKEVKRHLHFSAKVVLLLLSLFFLFLMASWAVQHWEEAKWQKDHQKILLWYEDNLPQLNRWYDSGDMETLASFYKTLPEDEFSAFYSWDHADVVFAYVCWADIQNTVEQLQAKETVEKAQLSSVLYDSFSLLFFSGSDFTQDGEQQWLEQFQSSAWQLTALLGFEPEEAQAFYEENEEYGVISYSCCSDYVDKYLSEVTE